MKRFARLLGILGGLVAVIWAMRDRFISLTIPREPEPPAFRSPPDEPMVRPTQPFAPAPVEELQPELSPEPGTDDEVEPPPDEPEREPQNDDLTEVNGVGPVFAGKLEAAGITTFAALAAMDEGSLSETLGSSLGRIPAILDDARRLAGEK